MMHGGAVVPATPPLHTVRMPRRFRSAGSKVERLVARDGGERCHYCSIHFGRTPQRTVDHLVPIANGGSNSLENLVLACWPCNKHKGTRDAAVFLASKYVALRRRQVAAHEARLASTAVS
jgi:5-methylcytosine-specific restriction endonuclease McrA